MDIIHITVTFEDTFSFAKEVKHVSRSVSTFEKMKKDIGKVVVNYFDKKNAIHKSLRLVSVERSK